jgi:hypothetical protein
MSFRKTVRSPIDRRSGYDRRRVYSAVYFLADGQERRVNLERRRTGELRKDWVRISEWNSVYAGALEHPGIV